MAHNSPPTQELWPQTPPSAPNLPQVLWLWVLCVFHTCLLLSALFASVGIQTPQTVLSPCHSFTDWFILSLPCSGLLRSPAPVRESSMRKYKKMAGKSPSWFVLAKLSHLVGPLLSSFPPPLSLHSYSTPQILQILKVQLKGLETCSSVWTHSYSFFKPYLCISWETLLGSLRFRL